MSHTIHEDNYGVQGKGVTVRRGLKEAGDGTARRGTRTTEQARVPRTSWHNTAKSGEPRERVNGALVQ